MKHLVTLLWIAVFFCSCGQRESVESKYIQKMELQDVKLENLRILSKLQTSTASGTYCVEIETEDGSMYYGTYTL